MKRALIVVDFTYDFVADDGKLTVGKPAQKIDEEIARGIEEAILLKDDIFIVNDLHYENDPGHPECQLFPPHNICGTKGREMYGKTGEILQQYAYLNDHQIYYMDKLRYSGFEGTSLNLLLCQRNISDIEICGVCTDICVLHTAVSAYNLGYHVTVRSNRVASFNPQGHEFALEHFKNSLGFNVIN